MDWLGLLVTLGVTGSMAVGVSWWFIDCQRQARFLLYTPTSKVRSAAQGYVELYGFVGEQAEQLQAPLTGEPCAWWSYRIEEYQRSGNNKHHSWRTLDSKTSKAFLRFEDDTGHCLINPEGARVIPVSRQVWQGNDRHPQAPQPQHWLNILVMGRRRYRYTEERLHSGDPLYVIGHFYSQGGGHQTFDIDRMQWPSFASGNRTFPACLSVLTSIGMASLMRMSGTGSERLPGNRPNNSSDNRRRRRSHIICASLTKTCPLFYPVMAKTNWHAGYAGKALVVFYSAWLASWLQSTS